MIEKTLIAYLIGNTTVPVYAEIPTTPPAEFVVLRRIDGGMINKINAATFNIECYSTTLQKAAELNETIQELLFDSVSLDSITSAKLGGESSNIDTASKKYRYESVFNFYYYR